MRRAVALVKEKVTSGLTVEVVSTFMKKPSELVEEPTSKDELRTGTGDGTADGGRERRAVAAGKQAQGGGKVGIDGRHM